MNSLHHYYERLCQSILQKIENWHEWFKTDNKDFREGLLLDLEINEEEKRLARFLEDVPLTSLVSFQHHPSYP